MKRLKLDHKIAGLVRNGSKNSTWRLYDDKDLQVNDQVELIDKVDPGNPSTWTSVGIARIDKIIEKRLGEIAKEDVQGRGGHVSREERLKNFQRHYGPQVTFETAVKIIHFTLERNAETEDNLLQLTEVKLYADGGSRGNPGPSASGFVIMSMDGQVVVKKGVYLGITTNNQAEYQALKLGLEEAKEMRIREVHVYMDSLLVVNQMLGKFKVKNRDLWPIYESTRQLVSNFYNVSFTHVPRELNKVADGAVNEALDQAIVL
jgi:ribonuclease HI